MNAIKTILYVEDSPYNLLLVKAILASRKDLQLLTAATAAQGLATAQHHQFDLLLLDLNLPDMRGEELLRRFRMIPGFECIPVIVISGESVPDRLERLKHLGVADILIKPFDIDQFEQTINQCLVGVQ